MSDWIVLEDTDGTIWAVDAQGHWWSLETALRIASELADRHCGDADYCNARDYLATQKALFAEMNKERTG